MNPHDRIRDALAYAEIHAPDTFGPQARDDGTFTNGVLARFNVALKPRSHVEWGFPPDQVWYGNNWVVAYLVMGDTQYSYRLPVSVSNAEVYGGKVPKYRIDDFERTVKAKVLHEFGRQVGLWPHLG